MHAHLLSCCVHYEKKVRVDVSARHHGKIQAALTENRRGLSEFVLEPLKDEQYFEVGLDLQSSCLCSLVPLPFLQIIVRMSTWCYLVLLQVREPFSIMSIVKSPMGLMMGFMLIVVFLMPKLMENMGMLSKIHLQTFLISCVMSIYVWLCLLCMGEMFTYLLQEKFLRLVLYHSCYLCFLSYIKI